MLRAASNPMALALARRRMLAGGCPVGTETDPKARPVRPGWR